MKKIFVLFFLVININLFSQELFIDEFENNSNEWPIYSGQLETQISNGKLYLKAALEGKIAHYSKDIFINYEKDYRIKVNFKFKKGNSESFFWFSLEYSKLRIFELF